jgi:hypothetical protein
MGLIMAQRLNRGKASAAPGWKRSDSQSGQHGRAHQFVFKRARKAHKTNKCVDRHTCSAEFHECPEKDEPEILPGKSCERQFRSHAVEVRPIVFEFGENRVPVYPATAAVFITKFCDFNLI